ncbi:hypothetical protein Ait01nite_066390 [Actinoplanes italicus]|nr:hypothetical protein Ait01nite_066390 [Actinoplanes italicus]
MTYNSIAASRVTSERGRTEAREKAGTVAGDAESSRRPRFDETQGMERGTQEFLGATAPRGEAAKLRPGTSARTRQLTS